MQFITLKSNKMLLKKLKLFKNKIFMKNMELHVEVRKYRKNGMKYIQPQGAPQLQIYFDYLINQ